MFATLLMLYRNYEKWAGLNTQGRLDQQSTKDPVNRLNKLLQLTTHLSHVKPLSPQQYGTLCHFNQCTPKLLQILLAAFVSSKSGAVEVASELPHASIAKHRLM
jgi:hypothetical protein